MQNGPEMSSNEPTPVPVSVDEVAQDVLLTDSQTDSKEEQPVVETVNGNSDEVVHDHEAPSPQPVQLFDLGDELGETQVTPASDDDEGAVSVTPDTEAEVIERPNEVATAAVVDANIPLVSPSPSQSADDEIFEQVMGSSRVDDIPAPRRSTPGSIPLPPQLAEEQARRDRAAQQSTDSRGRSHPLPESSRNTRRTPPSRSTTTAQPAAGSSHLADVICPKCQRTTSTRFTFCMKCGTDFPPGYVASLTGHHPKPSTPGGRDGVRDTRTTVRQINRIHESRGSGRSNETNGTHQTVTSEPYASVYPASGLAENPFLVAFISFLMPGLGHMMMGEYKKGLPWLFAGIAAMAFLPSWSFTIWIPLFLRVFAAINAYQLAIIKQDEQRDPFDMDDDA